jgi:hypothetical protein
MSKNTKGNPLTRRDFVTRTLAATAGFTIVPSFAVSGLGHMAPSDKLNIAGIGIGGMGFDNLKSMQTENIVGLCDVDWKYAERVFNHYPNAKKYKDFRKMYDEMGKSIDAIVVATADHTHGGLDRLHCCRRGAGRTGLLVAAGAVVLQRTLAQGRASLAARRRVSAGPKPRQAGQARIGRRTWRSPHPPGLQRRPP